MYKIQSGVMISVSISPTMFATKNKVFDDKLSWTGNAVSTKDSQVKGVTGLGLGLMTEKLQQHTNLLKLKKQQRT